MAKFTPTVSGRPAKVLVTGGLGIIGAFVCRALLETGRQPIIYDGSMNTGLISDIAKDCVIEQGDICDMPKMLGIIDAYNPVGILHFAGQPGPRVEKFPWAALQSNFIGTATVFECARLSGISRIVLPSSKAVYGKIGERHGHPVYEPVSETHPREPLRHYSKLKRAAEDLGDHYARLYGLDIIALRFGSAFGPGKAGLHANVSPVIAVIEAAIHGRPIRVECGADQRDDLCYSGESANGAIAALDSPGRPGEFRVYNIASGQLISMAEMIATLSELYPSWKGEVGPGLDYRRSSVADYFLMNTSRAREEIGFQPKFDFKSAVLDYAATLNRLRNFVAQ